MADDFAHHGVDFEHIAQPAVLEELPEQNHGRAVAIHVAHLDEQLLLSAAASSLLILRQRFAGGFIEMDVLAGVDAALGRVEQIADVRLDEDCGQARRVEQLLLCDEWQIAKCWLFLGPLREVRLSGSTMPTTS